MTESNLWAALAGFLFCLPATIICFYRAWKERADINNGREEKSEIPAGQRKQ